MTVTNVQEEEIVVAGTSEAGKLGKSELPPEGMLELLLPPPPDGRFELLLPPPKEPE